MNELISIAQDTANEWIYWTPKEVLGACFGVLFLIVCVVVAIILLKEWLKTIKTLDKKNDADSDTFLIIRRMITHGKLQKVPESDILDMIKKELELEKK